MQEALDLSFDRLLMMIMMMMMMIIHSLGFPQNAVCLIILPYLVPVLFTFYIQRVLKLKKNSGAIRLNELIAAEVTHSNCWGKTGHPQGCTHCPWNGKGYSEQRELKTIVIVAVGRSAVRVSAVSSDFYR